jgi:predicted RNA-binding Zn-ribbon protein involved in translation (DUF1610 family)
MWLLSFVFASFLIGLGGLVIQDLPRVDEPIQQADFIDADAYLTTEEQLELLDQTRRTEERQVQEAATALETAARELATARTSLQNWLATRRATQQQEQDPEILSRTRLLDELEVRRLTAQERLTAEQTEQQNIERAIEDIHQTQRDLFEDARPAYEGAIREQELRVFLYRLALTLPLLVVSAWFIKAKRRTSYWPLYRGFVLFALFAFFWELVPYLPSYGGYVRYVVGIILVALAGIYAIRGMNRYLERKREEEARSEEERRDDIDYETALKKTKAKTCPGCDRKMESREDATTFFCVHCGLRLRTKCGSCGETNISFHHYCLSCGTPLETAVGTGDDAPPMPA